jgi:hypothetical protein
MWVCPQTTTSPSRGVHLFDLPANRPDSVAAEFVHPTRLTAAEPRLSRRGPPTAALAARSARNRRGRCSEFWRRDRDRRDRRRRRLGRRDREEITVAHACRWCCGTSSRFSAAKWPGRGYVLLTAPCSQRQPFTCGARWATRGCHSTDVSLASGACAPEVVAARRGVAGHRCRLRCGSWCYGSRARIRAGAIGGSAPSWPSSASGCRRRASAGCSCSNQKRGVTVGSVSGGTAALTEGANQCIRERRGGSHERRRCAG